jgi:CBS domain containing-hemolysin-like protein
MGSMHISFSVLFALLTLLAVSLQRTYAQVPLKEFKHRARNGDNLAAAILKAAGYGHSLRAALWFLIGVTSAGFFVSVSLQTQAWLALTLSVILVWASFVWLPAGRVTIAGEHIAAWAAPLLAKLLLYIHPIIDWIVRLVRRYKPITIHSGLYDRGDLIDLLERQQVQPDSRIERAELDIALHALSFGDDTVGQHMVPRRTVKAVSADEPLGPIIMDELYASGHSRFPVYEGKKENIIGTLFLRDLIKAKKGGLVRSLMKKQVSYVHEDQSLQDALQAILKTHHQLFVVVNSFEEYVGIITIEDVLETIIGNPIIDEFDQYDDLRAVAARAANKEHQEHIKETTEEITEVIE